MPVFEYRCMHCGHVTSFLERPGQAGPHTCEKCGSKDTRKLFSTFAAPSKPEASSCPTCCPGGACSLS